MAGWDQAVGGAPILALTSNGLEILTDGAGQPIIGEDGSGWLALQIAKTAVAGAFSQDASWEAAASQELESAAGWSQDATWAALGQSAEDVTADATFDQAAASWLGASSELAVGSATWLQAALWDASIEQAGVEPPVEPPAEIPIRPHGVRIGPAQGAIRRPPPIAAEASFGQPSADWYSYLTVNDDALVLVLV